MPNFNLNQRLNGLNPLSYQGVNPSQPSNFVTKNRPPTPNDSKGFLLGDVWLDITGYPNTLPTATNVWMLVALVGNVATWVHFGSGSAGIQTLTGNSGGAVSPDNAGNTNVVGDGTYIDIVGNPGTNTLTASLINGGNYASSFITNPATGTAVPVLGVLTFAGAGSTTVSAAGSTITITSTDTGATSFPTDSGTATPLAGALKIWSNNAANNAGSSVKFTGSTNEVLLNVTDANNNTFIGQSSGNLTTTATHCVGIGKSTLNALTSGASSTAVGSGAGANVTTGSRNTLIGKDAGSNLTTETDNILINNAGIAGLNRLIAINFPQYPGLNDWFLHNYPAETSGNGTNVYIGQGAGNFTQTGTFGNNVIGESALSAVTTGQHNCILGNGGLALGTTAEGNVGIGHGVMYNALAATGLITGIGNVAIGYTAGKEWTGNESDNIYISTTGYAGENNTIRIGGFTAEDTLQTRCFIQAIRGVTTTNNNAIAVLIDSAGQLGTVSSSRRYKENINDMGSYSDVIRSLRPVIFNYKQHSPESISVGLIAEEVAEVAPQLVVYDKEGNPETVKYHDLVPMLLNEYKEHCTLIASLQAIVADLMNRIKLLEEDQTKKHCC